MWKSTLKTAERTAPVTLEVRAIRTRNAHRPSRARPRVPPPRAAACPARTARVAHRRRVDALRCGVCQFRPRVLSREGFGCRMNR